MSLLYLLALLALDGAAPVAMAQNTADSMPGRLFLTEEERRQLDEIREFDDKAPEGSDSKPIQAESLRFTVNGYVSRSGGSTAAWVNGRLLPGEETTPEGVRIRLEDSEDSVMSVTLDSGYRTQLKAGQRIEIEQTQTTVLEPFEIEAMEGEETDFDLAREEQEVNSEAPDFMKPIEETIEGVTRQLKQLMDLGG